MTEHSQKQIKEVIENLEQAIPFLRKAMVELDVREKHDRYSAVERRELLEKAYNLKKYLRDQIE